MKKEKKLLKSFDLGTAVLAVLVGFCVQIVFQYILSLFSLPAKTYTWIVVIMNQLIFFGVALIFCFCPKKKVSPLAITGAKEPPKWYYFPIFILIAIACVTCFGPISGLFRRMLSKLGYDYTPQYFIPRDNAGLFTLAFFALTILPVLGEEFMLRGVLMSGTKKHSAVFAILYTALIFALIHGNLNQLIHQFLLGAIMGYVAYLTGGIYASAVIHITNNAMAMLLDYGFANNFVNHSFYYYVAGELGVAETLIGIMVSFFALAMFLVLFTALLHRDRARVKDYNPTFSTYLLYLATPTAEREKEASEEREGKKMNGYSLMLVIFLAVMLAAIVLLTLIPGAKG